MPRLQLLVATMNLTDIIGLCDKMHIASDALIINQSDCVKYECLFYHGYKIECYTFAERGLSRSRNNALLRCTGEILCIADDDMVYTDTYREDIINEFQKHPEADALVFNVTALNDERSGKPMTWNDVLLLYSEILHKYSYKPVIYLADDTKEIDKLFEGGVENRDVRP